MNPLDAGPHQRLGPRAARRVDSERKFEERISSVFEVVIGQRLDAGQRLQNFDDVRLVQPEEIFSADECRKNFDQIIFSSHLFDDGQHLHPNAPCCLSFEISFNLISVFVERNCRNVKLGLVVDLGNAAGVRTTLVQLTQRPVVSDDLVSDGEDVISGVKVVKLVRQNLTDRQEEERADSQNLSVNSMSHHFGNLSVFVAIDVHSSVDCQGCQLLIFFALGHVLVAVNTFVLEENCPIFVGTSDVVKICAADFETLDSGSVLFTDFAVKVDTGLQGRLDVDESAVLSFVNFLRPECAVEMNPLVDVVVEKPGGTVGRTVTLHVTEETLARVLSVSWRHHRHSHLEHHGRQVIFVQLLVAFLRRSVARCHRRIIIFVQFPSMFERIILGDLCSLGFFSLFNLDSCLLLFLPLFQLLQICKCLSVS